MTKLIATLFMALKAALRLAGNQIQGELGAMFSQDLGQDNNFDDAEKTNGMGAAGGERGISTARLCIPVAAAP
jgi:hypothetical protein